MTTLYRILAIVGPTASGKTALAARVAQEMGGAIVSADSRQVYTGLDIGTATPKNPASGISGQEPKQYLINIRDPDQPLTLAEWQQAALAVIDRLAADGTLPILVGGTMLYIDSVVDNFAIPDISPNVQLRERLTGEKAPVLYERLIKLDGAAADFVSPNNKRRIIRALEVIEATGEPFSALRRTHAARRYDVAMIGIEAGWDSLRKRIAARAQQMFKDGLLDETRRLQKRYGADLPLLQIINYREAAKVLAGELSEEEAVSEMIRSNMRYARRQMSWWRRRSNIRWITSPESFALSDLSQLWD